MTDGPSVSFPDVDAIVVATGSSALLEGAVASVIDQVAPGRVVVIDATGGDVALAGIASAHPTVHVVATPARTFAAAVNAGIAATSGQFVLILRPESRLEAKDLGVLVSRMKANRRVGIASPKVLDPSGSLLNGSFGQFPTAGRAAVFHLNRLAHRISRGMLAGEIEVATTLPVDWVIDTCALVRRSAIDEVGPMDESFTQGYQDVEWCRRMRDHEWTVLIEPTASCTQGCESAPAAGVRDDFYRFCRLRGLRGCEYAARLGLEPSHPARVGA